MRPHRHRESARDLRTGHPKDRNRNQGQALKGAQALQLADARVPRTRGKMSDIM